MIQKDIILLAAYILLWVFVLTTRRYHLVRPALIAIVLALGWTFFAQQEYGYNTPMVTEFGLNLFPLVGWSLGLMIAYLIFISLRRLVIANTWWKKLLLLNAFYLPLLLLAETIAYHVFGVVNLATASFEGLPFCDCLHAPFWMQMSYFSMATVYLSILMVLKLDEPPAPLASDASAKKATT